MSGLARLVLDKIPQTYKDTALVRLFGLGKIPLLFFLQPSVIEFNQEHCVVKIPLNWRSRNHHNSMYFAALAAGADLAAGLIALKTIMDNDYNMSFLFKDMHAQFLKRAEADTYFECTQVLEIQNFIHRLSQLDERQDLNVVIKATTPSVSGDEVVAIFNLTMSIKNKGLL